MIRHRHSHGQNPLTQRGKLKVIGTGTDAGETPPDWPALAKYVRVRSRARAGYVEFDFSIGDPGLFLEMILPEAAFEDFCARNQVQFVTEAQAAAIDAAESRWQYGEPGDADDNSDQ